MAYGHSTVAVMFFTTQLYNKKTAFLPFGNNAVDFFVSVVFYSAYHIHAPYSIYLSKRYAPLI